MAVQNFNTGPVTSEAGASEAGGPNASTSPTLLHGLRNQDREAWDQFVRLWGPLIYSRCRKWLSEESAEDVSQEVLVAVSRNISSFQRDGRKYRFRHWMSVLILNKVRDHWRKHKQHTDGVGGSDHLKVVGNIPDPAGDEDDSWCHPALIVARALDLLRPTLSADVQRMVELVYFKNYSSSDAARELGKTPEAVRQALCRVRKELKNLLGGLLD